MVTWKSTLASMFGIVSSLSTASNGLTEKRKRYPMSGDTDLTGQLTRLAESVLFLSQEVSRLRKTVNTLHDINMEQNTILAGLASNDKALYERILKLESRRIHLYLGEDNEPCIGQGDWQDTLEGFTTPRDFADEFQDRDDSHIDPNDAQ